MNTQTVTAQLIDAAQRQATNTPVAEICQHLVKLLGQSLTAFIVGVQHGRTVVRWANTQVTNIDPDNEQKLRTTYGIVCLLSEAYSPATARGWLITPNHRLDDLSPAEALHEGKLKEALSAARSHIVP